MAPDPPGDAGFTLLEVLIASLIAALALGVLFRATVESRTGAAVAAQYQEALSRARSRLAAVDAAPLAPGDSQGDDGGGFRWRVRTSVIEATTAAPPAPAPALYGVNVAVSWGAEGHERTVQLDTRRVGAAPTPPP